eukprot:scaffold22131_cov100-Isochrysis_galbana.AAC.1
MRVHVPRPSPQVHRGGCVGVMEHGQVLVTPQQHVRLEHVLVERVDAPPHSGVSLRPGARPQVDVGAQQVVAGTVGPDGRGSTERRSLCARGGAVRKRVTTCKRVPAVNHVQAGARRPATDAGFCSHFVNGAEPGACGHATVLFSMFCI